MHAYAKYNNKIAKFFQMTMWQNIQYTFCISQLCLKTNFLSYIEHSTAIMVKEY